MPTRPALLTALTALVLAAALPACDLDLDLGGSVALAETPHAATLARDEAAPRPEPLPAPAEAPTPPGTPAQADAAPEVEAAAQAPEPSLDAPVEGAGQGLGEPLPGDLATLDLPYTELIRKFRKPANPGSLGSTLRGRLHGAAELPLEGEHHAVLPDCRERLTRYGTPDLVNLILRASAAVHAAHPGPRLMVGNLSFEGGGNIPWSRSHNSGLDADLAFFVRQASDDQPVETPALMRFGRNLQDKDELGYTFDLPRNWALIKALLTDPEVNVQFLFISRPLRRRLLDYARAQNEPAELIARAERVVMQPRDAPSHNDHLHVRIFCPARDRVEGCDQKEPVWPWVETQKLPTLIRAAALAKGLEDKKSETRLAVLSRLDDLPGYFAAPALAGAWLRDPSEDVRARAIDMLMRWRDLSFGLAFALEGFIRPPGAGIAQDDPAFSRDAQPWTPQPGDLAPPLALTITRDGNALRGAYRLLGMLGLRQSAPFLAEALRSNRTIDLGVQGTLPEALMAAQATRHVHDLRLVPALLDALAHPDAEVRDAADRTLRRITNHSFNTARWDKNTTEAQRRDQIERWRAWWADHQHLDHDALLLQGFKAVQPAMPAQLDGEAVKHLIPLTGRKDHIGYNADRALQRITDHWSPLDAKAEDRLKHWEDWRRSAPDEDGGAEE